MKEKQYSKMRCPYKAGEIPERPNRRCARCKVAKDPVRARDRAKHLNCDFLESKNGQKKTAGRPGPKNKATQQKTGTNQGKVASTKQNRTSKSRRNRYFDGYDGYYEDVIPVDNGGTRQGVDVTLVKKVSALVAGVLFVVGACVSIMYFL